MTGHKRQIIALGGGGFGAGDISSPLDRYILSQARTPRPAVAYIGTARGDADVNLVKFYRAFSGHDCRPSHLPFFERTPALSDHIRRQDVIYVGGGNTKSMLAVWRDWGLPELLREAWERGAILAGVSAGAICWFQQGITDSYAEKLVVLECVGLLEGSCCPHYDGEAERRPAYHEFISKGQIAPGLAIEDGVAVHLIDGAVHRVVASKPTARAYRVSVKNGSVHEEPLKTDFLGKAGDGH
jgi:peptidase E